MAIEGYTKSEFGEKLNKVVSASQPIQSIQYLFGRERELDRIEKALYANGRHIFIFGDRGVGKSSLAATAASQYQSPDMPYIDVSASPDSTLASIVANIAYQAINATRLSKVKTSINKGFEFKWLKIGSSQEVTPSDLYCEIRTLVDAVEVLREVAIVHSQKPVVVLDEFDRIQDVQQRNLFADMLKHLGDKKIPIKFIFTAVGKTLEELLGAHQSAIRQLETIELFRLDFTARWNIVETALNEFNLTLDHNTNVRISLVSDGFPYYIHLIAEHMLWKAFEDVNLVTDVTKEHYQSGLREAIESIHAELKRPYEKVIHRQSDDYEEVLWSTADSEDLHRYVKDMYSSYTFIMRQRPHKKPLDQTTYGNRIRSLKLENCGTILTPDETHKGMYSYREKMFRGYVRMQAEAHGIELAGDKLETPRAQIHIPAKIRQGYRGSSVPKGVQMGRGRDSAEWEID